MTEVLVLAYHAVSPTWKAALSITPDALERQLSLLLRRGWRPATFTEAILAPAHQRTLAVTFDDAFASVRTRAEPILAALGVRATVFAPTAFMSHPQFLAWPGIDHWQRTPDKDELLSMDWDALGALMERGWEIGSHTCTHPHLTDLDDAVLREELEASRRECSERLNAPCRALAYPYGDVDDRVVELAREAGYEAGACLSSEVVNKSPLRWPRVGVYHADESRARFWLKATGILGRVRGSWLWRSG